MNLFKSTGWTVIFLLLPVIIFFYPVWGQGKNPIPADTITGLYHPFRDAVADEYPNGTPYKNFLITDAIRQQYLWRQFSVEQLKQTQIPWWNPYNFSGTPHFANFQSAAFYPLNLIFWLTSFTTGWNILVVSQMVLGATFLYLYLAKSLKLNPLASLIGSLSWIFSGFFIAWLEWNTAVHVAVWSPVILLSIDQLFSSSNSKKLKYNLIWAGILSFGLTAQFYAGYPQPWLYLSIMQIGYGCWRLAQIKNLKFKVLSLKALTWAMSYLVFVVLALPQLFSTLEFSDLSNRVNDQGNVLEKIDWFLPAPQLIQMLVPDFFGNPTTRNYWGIFNYTEFVSFIGVIPFGFVLISLISIFKFKNPKAKFNPVIIFFSLFLGLSLLLAIKNPISIAQFKYNIPFLGSSQPSRWLVITNLTLAILVAFGVDLYLKKPNKMILPLMILSLIFSVLWLSVLQPSLINSPTFLENVTVAKRNLILPTLELGALVLIVGFSLILKTKYFKNKINFKLIPSFSILVMFFIVAFSGIRFGNKFVAFSNKEFLYPQTEIITYLQNNAGLYRYATDDRRMMAPNINMAYDLYTIEGYDPLYLFDYSRLIYATEHQNQEYRDNSKPFNRIVTTDKIQSPIIDLLGVKYIVTPNWLPEEKFELIMTEGITRLYLNPRVYPRAFFTKSAGDYLEVYPDSQATILEYYPNQVKIELDAESSGYLILTDAYHPDWIAAVNGEPQEIENWYGLRRLKINQGKNEIEYNYRHSYL